MKTLVNCNEQDDIRIVRAGGAGAVTIAASRALAMADVFRWMFVNEDWDLSLFEVELANGETGWECTAGNLGAEGESPWDAVCNLADKFRSDI